MTHYPSTFLSNHCQIKGTWCNNSIPRSSAELTRKPNNLSNNHKQTVTCYWDLIHTQVTTSIMYKYCPTQFMRRKWKIIFCTTSLFLLCFDLYPTQSLPLPLPLPVEWWIWFHVQNSLSLYPTFLWLSVWRECYASKIVQVNKSHDRQQENSVKFSVCMETK